MNSFWTLSTFDKCAALASLVQTLSKARLTSLQMLAAARGETIEEIWQRCCREAGVEPCSVPLHLFGRLEDEPMDLPEEDELSTTGFIARARLLADLRKERALETRHLHAHVMRS
jgi:hypothetical protein